MLEPLHPRLWEKTLQGIATSMASDAKVDEFAGLRRLYHVLALSPPALRQWFAPSLPEDLFELVLRQSSQAAALSLIGQAFDLAVTTDKGDEATISLWLREADTQVTVRDTSIARAIVCAVCEIGLGLPEA